MFKFTKSAIVLLLSVASTEAYCTWKGVCDGEAQGGSYCGSSEVNCLSCGNNPQWCANTSPTGPPGYCNWNSCDGEVQGGDYCNQSQGNCESCGTSDPNYQPRWCLYGSTAAPVPAPIPAPAPVPAPAPQPSPGTGSPQEEGYLTWWTASYGSVQGGSCEYASTTSTALGDSWLGTYITPGMHCAVSDDLFLNGAGCGKCYHVVWDGTGGTNQGTPSSAVVQVTNSGAGGAKHFDCFDDAFHAVTGTNTGIFPLTYYEVDCVETLSTVVVLDGNNAWYTKVLVAGGKSAVSGVTVTIGNSSFSMYRNSGATWAANNLNGATGSAKFDIMFDNGITATVDDCFNGNWPVATSSICQ